MEKTRGLEVVIVGGGRRCRDLLSLLAEYEPRKLKLHILGVADPDKGAPGLQWAKKAGLYTTSDFRKLLARFPQIDLIIELTGKDEVLEEILASKPKRAKVLDHLGATLFWEIIELLRERNLYERRLAQAEMNLLTTEIICHLAHEIRNPLAVIGGLAKHLKDENELSEGLKKNLEAIITEVARLEKVMQELAEVAQPIRPRLELLDLNRLVKELGREASKEWVLEIEFRLEPDLPEIYADPKLLKRAVFELLKNAAEALEKENKKRIILETRLCYDSLAVVVIDSGPGMDEEILKKAPFPFFTTKPQASGLGLYLAQKIARAHGGRLYLYSKPGEGTIAAIELPVLVKRPVPPV